MDGLALRGAKCLAGESCTSRRGLDVIFGGRARVPLLACPAVSVCTCLQSYRFDSLFRKNVPFVSAWRTLLGKPAVAPGANSHN